MKKIKFSHDYIKFPEKIRQRPTYLISICKTSLEELPKIFLTWDTTYIRRKGEVGVERYPLPEKGECMVLLFMSPDFVYKGKAYPFKLWTTIRRWTPSKEEYYLRAVGEVFEVVVKKEE